MKDSGVAWIGEVPEEWKIVRVKNRFIVITGNGFPLQLQGKEIGDYPMYKAGDISRHNGASINSAANWLTEDVVRCKGFNIIPKGSILFPKIGEAMRKNSRALAAVDCCVDNNCQALVPQGFDRFYAMYLLTCIDMNWFDNAGTIPCLSNGRLMSAPIPSPHKSEQREIAAYLDAQCGKIEALRGKLEKEIERLGEYKKSVITEAVTKGLKRGRKMKDSGVAWIGEVPEEWKVDRLQWYLEEVNDLNTPVRSEFILSLTNDRGVIPYSEKGNQGNKAKEDVLGYKLAYKGCIVANSMNIIIGSVGLSKYDGCVSPVYYVFRARENADIRYLNYIFQIRGFQRELRKFANGILEIRLRVSSWSILRRWVPIASIAEQKEIVSYLDHKCAAIDAAVAKCRRQMDLLTEYRKSLIYECVTGKKEVA